MSSSPDRPGPRYKVELVVDGERMPLRSFIHDVVGGTVQGLVAGLKGAEGADRIEIRIERRRADARDDASSD
ncbi:MAG: hypothetical protein R3F20_01275 [Planctomycetota bacterium]